MHEDKQCSLQADTIAFGEHGQSWPPSTQNNKYKISLQYLKKQVSDKVNFLHTDKH